MDESIRNRAIFRSVATLVLLGLLGSAASGEEAVGKYGDLRRMQIAGAGQIGEDEIRRALGQDFDTQLACHPLAPRRELAAAVAGRLQAGLQRAGFADARVDVRLDDAAERLGVHVEEGPRFVCGQVQLRCDERVPKEQLTERLTCPFVPEKAVQPAVVQSGGKQVTEWRDRDGKRVDLSDPVWKAGAPAPLDLHAPRRLTTQVRQALEDLGYRAARFEVGLERHPETRTVDLLVQVHEAGPLATVTDVTVIGNQRSSQEAILELLGVRGGDVLTRRRQAELDYALWRSGRFLRHKVTAQTLNFGDQPTHLRIEVAESPYIAPLGQTPGREAETLRLARDFLSNPDGWQSDLVVTRRASVGVTELILAPQHGFVLVHTAAESNSPPAVVLLATADKVLCRVAGLPQRLEFPLANARLEVEMSQSLNEKPDGDDGPFLLKLGLGVGGKTEKQLVGSPVTFSLDVHPSAAMAFLQARRAQTTWHGSQLAFDSDKEHFLIDSTTGRLIECRNKFEGGELTLGFVKDAFETRVAALQPNPGDQPNAFDADRPLTSSLVFLCDAVLTLQKQSGDELPEWGQAVAQSVLVVRTLLARGVLQDVDALVIAPPTAAANKLDLPVDDHGASAGLGMIAGHLALAAADTCFPRESWLWTVWREAGFTAAGKGVYTSGTLHQLHSTDQLGPIGALVVTTLLQCVNSPMAGMFAARGQRDTSVEAFRKDLLPLMDQQALFGRLLARTAVILQELDEPAVANLLGRVPAADGPWLAAVVDQLRRDRQQPPDLALIIALERGWQEGLRERVVSALATRNVR